MTTAIRKAVRAGLSTAIVALDRTHRILIRAGMIEVADCVEAAVDAIAEADRRLKIGAEQLTVLA